jgi:hypothetical protein
MKDHIQVIQVFFPRLGVDNDIVHVHEGDLPREASEGDVDKTLEVGRRVLEPKGRSRKLIETFVRSKSRLLLVFCPHRDLPVARVTI